MKIFDAPQCPPIDMRYQKIVESVRTREDLFADVRMCQDLVAGAFTGSKKYGWPGGRGPAQSKYPNLAAELDARDRTIDTPCEAAEISRRALAGAIEDGDTLDCIELRLIAGRMGLSYSYLCSPVLSMVKPATNRGRYFADRLRRIVAAVERNRVKSRVHLDRARIVLACLERGEPVTYASWSWGCLSLMMALERHREDAQRYNAER